jgi:Tol biopolymer transport system component
VRELPLPAHAWGWASLDWSHDGRSLLLRQRPDGDGEALLRIDIRTGAVERLPVAGEMVSFAVVPGHPQLVISRQMRGSAGATGQVVVLDLESGGERLIAEVPGDYSYLRLAVAPDASSIAVAASSHSRTSIMLYPFEPGEGRTLLEWDGFLAELVFTADGTGLYFTQTLLSGNRREDRQVQPWLLDLRGGEPRALDLLPWASTWLRPHPDGLRIATVAGTMEDELWVLENIPPARPNTLRRSGAVR